MKRINLANVVANIVLGICVVISLTLIFATIAPADVLKNWNVSVDTATYHPGSVITLHTSSTKLRKANGSAHRAIECDTTNENTVAYPVIDYEAKALPGYVSGKSNIVIPTNIANTPATCRIIITIDYQVYLFRHISEYAASNDFIIE